MSENAPTFFRKEFQSDVQVAYQRKGSKLRNTVRTKQNVKGESTYFNKVGKAEVGDKARGGNIPVLSTGKSRVKCDLVAKYGGEYVEALDEIMSSVDEKKVIAESLAYAHGRHTDKLIIDQLISSAVTQVVGDHTAGMGQGLAQSAIEALNTADVPDDGDRTALVTTHGWEELLKIDAFAKAEYIGSGKLPWLDGSEAKRWRNCLWTVHTGLPIIGTDATCVIYHKTAVGHAIGLELTTTWSWENEKDAHFLNTKMLQGVALIDPTGIVKLKIKNDTAL